MAEGTNDFLKRFYIDNTNCNEVTTTMLLDGHADCVTQCAMPMSMKGEGQRPTDGLRLSLDTAQNNVFLKPPSALTTITHTKWLQQ